MVLPPKPKPGSLGDALDPRFHRLFGDEFKKFEPAIFSKGFTIDRSIYPHLNADLDNVQSHLEAATKRERDLLARDIFSTSFDSESNDWRRVSDDYDWMEDD